MAMFRCGLLAGEGVQPVELVEPPQPSHWQVMLIILEQLELQPVLPV